MADRDNDRDRDAARSDRSDTERDLDRALQRETKDLQGDAEDNRNLSGSTTWQTLTEEEQKKRDQR